MSELKPLGISADLSGQTALVTGASQGLGKAVAIRLGEAGAKVLCVARSADKLAETVAAIEAAGGQGSLWDATSPIGLLLRRSLRRSRPNTSGSISSSNNAGITRDTLLPAMTDEQWDDIIAANLTSCFLFCRAGGRLMMRQRYGRIINMSSVSGLIGNPGQTKLFSHQSWHDWVYAVDEQRNWPSAR